MSARAPRHALADDRVTLRGGRDDRLPDGHPLQRHLRFATGRA